MSSTSLVEWASIVGGFATAFAAALAIIGIPLTYIQIRASRKTQREATAKDLYRKYLEDCISRPELVIPDLEKIRKEGKFIQYELFVAHMLYSLEEILSNTRGAGWEDVARGQLRRHLEYLHSDAFRHKRTYYDAQLINILDNLREPE